MGSPTSGEGRLPSAGSAANGAHVKLVDSCYFNYKSEIRSAPTTLVQMQVPPVQVVEVMPGSNGTMEMEHHNSQHLPVPDCALLGSSPSGEEVKTLQKRLVTEMQLSRALQSKLQWYEEERSRELQDLSRNLEALREKEKELEIFVSENRPRARQEQLQVKANAKKKVEHLEKQLMELKSDCNAKSGILQTRQNDMERLKSELAEKGAEAEELAMKLCEREKQVHELQQKVNNNEADLVNKFQSVQHEIKILQRYYEAFAGEVRAVVQGYSVLDDPVAKALMASVVKLNKDHEELKKKFASESAERKQLYNKVLELKGNIRVFCRCRPLSASEVGAGVTSVAEFDANRENDLVVRCNVNGTPTRKFFKFDRVFSTEASQGEVFADTAPVVTSVLDGYNVCIFAYGQTGTGKTFTMEGVPGNRGVNYLTLEELFKIAVERRGQVTYEIKVSVLEIYNEQIRDLLAPPVSSIAGSPKKLEIKQGQEGGHWVPGLVETKVTNLEEVWDALQNGSKNRSVGATNANEHSSRSHCMLCVMVRGENHITGEVTRSKLWLVDLAGSERVGKSEAQGDRLKEAQAINKSLSALGDVIAALTMKTAHVPYRNSKLTHLLQDSLGGDAKTLMFVQISPNDYDVGETLCSLNFASRVRGVELGPARRQTDCGELSKYKQMATSTKQELKSKDEMIKKLEESVRALEMKLKAKDSQCQTLTEKVRAKETGLADLEMQCTNEKKALQEARASQAAAETREAAANREAADARGLQEQALAALEEANAQLKEAHEATALARAEAETLRSEAEAAHLEAAAAVAAAKSAASALAEAKKRSSLTSEKQQRQQESLLQNGTTNSAVESMFQAEIAAEPSVDSRMEGAFMRGPDYMGRLADGNLEGWNENVDLQQAEATEVMVGSRAAGHHAAMQLGSMTRPNLEGWNENVDLQQAEATEVIVGSRAAGHHAAMQLGSMTRPWSASPRYSTNPNALTPTRSRKIASSSGGSSGSITVSSKDLSSLSTTSLGGSVNSLKEPNVECTNGGLQHVGGSWSATSIGSSTSGGSVSIEDQRSITPSSSDSGSVNEDGGNSILNPPKVSTAGGLKGYNGLLRLGAAADRMPLSGVKQNREGIDRSTDDPKRRKPVDKLVDNGDAVSAMPNGGSIVHLGGGGGGGGNSHTGGGMVANGAAATIVPDQKQKSPGTAAASRLAGMRPGAVSAASSQRSKTPVGRSGGGEARLKQISVLEWRERRWNN